MDKAIKIFDEYINFWVKFKPSAADKIVFCIFKGMNCPRDLMHRLGLAKGNLANYCKQLIKTGQIVQHTAGRAVEYELTAKGQEKIKKLLGEINDTL